MSGHITIIFHGLTALFWRHLIARMNLLSPHVLFVVEKPPKGHDGLEDLRWRNFCTNALAPRPDWPNSDSEPYAGPHTRIAENAWLIPLQGALPFLGRLSA